MSIIQKEYSPVEDTLQNYDRLLEDAKRFNTQNPSRSRFTAVVDHDGDNITVRIQRKSKDSDSTFRNQYQVQQLNKALSMILQPLGITVGMLNRQEVMAGRTGVTDFSKARQIATDTISMIRIANNMEGA